MNYDTYTAAAKKAFGVFADNYTALPKSEKEVKVILEKTGKAVEADIASAQEMFGICQKAMTGAASVEEVAKAQEIAKQLAVSARFAMLVSVPGMVFVLPTILETAKKYNVEILPASLAAQF